MCLTDETLRRPATADRLSGETVFLGLVEVEVEVEVEVARGFRQDRFGHDPPTPSVPSGSRTSAGCFQPSVASRWVDDEIAKALAKEQELSKDPGEMVRALIPLNLDGYMLSRDYRGTVLRAPPRR